MSNAAQPADARARLEDRFNGLYQLLRRFEGLQQQKDSVYQKYAHHYASYKTKWRAGMYWLWVLIGTIVLSVIAAIVTVGTMSAWTSSQQADTTAEPPLGVLALFLLPLPVALIAAGVIVAVRNSRVPAVNAKRERSNQETSVKIGELAETEIAPIDTQLQQARQEFRNGYGGWFPEKYLSSVDVGACWQIVHDHRASSVQDAVNRYLTDQHEQYLRNAASAQLAEQQRATRVAQMNGIINATMQGAMIGSIRAEGAATRAAMNAPRTVRFER